MEFLKKSPHLDDFSYHEVLDRCHLLMSMLNEHLIEHPVLDSHEEERVKLEEASNKIWDVYQSIGSATREPNEINGHAV
jgi:hypothetical protein